MKSMMRWSTPMLALALLACGDEAVEPTVDTHEDALKALPQMMLPVFKPAAGDEPDQPFEPAAEPAPVPAEPAPSPAEPGEDADEPAGDDGMGEVRETGFAAGPEEQAEADDAAEPEDGNGMDEVRETGFLPPPILELVALADDVAHLRWTAVPSINRYRLSGTRYGSDGAAVESFEIDTPYTQYALPLQGLRTVVGVSAIDDAGKARSKRSETLDLPSL